jgi:hypothetical protein
MLWKSMRCKKRRIDYLMEIALKMEGKRRKEEEIKGKKTTK